MGRPVVIYVISIKRPTSTQRSKEGRCY